ncbi:hypothetical protein [Haloferula sp.]|uniref:hypothetical protein n=1 Tax=Haloferula sp. TaxID=2497595 RepID=UPI00329CE5F3
MSPKAALLDRIRDHLSLRLDRLSQAAQDAHAAATDPDAKAESKYDTRSLEASYLAEGQAKQVDDAADAVGIFSTLTLPDFEMNDPIDSGALVEVDLDGEPSYFLLVPAAGGVAIEDEGREITLLTPASVLYRKLLGRKLGDSIDDPDGLITEVS